MKNLFLFSLLSIVLFLNVGAQKKAKHNIVFQFTDAVDTLQSKAFVKQLENVTEHWPTAKFEVVVYNQGIDLVTKNTHYKDRLIALKNKGVQFVVCENTLKNRKISKESLFQDLIQYVPSGIAEIVLKQEQGWSYIKGGF